MIRRGFLLCYLFLTLASIVVRKHRAHPHSSGQRLVRVSGYGNRPSLSNVVTIAYRDNTANSGAPVVVLLHGSPGSGHVFDGLAQALKDRCRIIVPDLPGFGHSTRDIPDYSFRSHAHYLLQLLDELHIPCAHLIGFSMGGGVALSMADIAPERVSSVVMLSAIGVQEQELTGNYTLNHALHAIQWAGLWIGRYALPHFGLLDNFPLSVEYARNFYDSDQRPLRAILAGYKGPMLIVHGSRDPLIPFAAALEHHRLVPQSELFVVESDHFIVFQRPWMIADRILAFVLKSDSNGG